jgi:dimethylamine/trimethylamine dehydrogenase
MIATGAKWAEDAIGRHSDTGFEIADKNMIIGAERILSGEKIDAECIVIYDDDHYYIGSVMALELAKRGHKIVLVTPAGRPCSWGKYTDEQAPSNLALYDANVKVITNKTIINVEQGIAEAKCIYSSEVTVINCDAIIPLTRRIPSVDLYNSLAISTENGRNPSMIKIGDADAPSHIAAAIYSGYRSAIECRESFLSSEFYGKRENQLI